MPSYRIQNKVNIQELLENKVAEKIFIDFKNQVESSFQISFSKFD